MHPNRVLSFAKRSIVPGAAYLGAGLCAVALWENSPFIAFLGAIVAATSALMSAVWQSEWMETIESQAKTIAGQANKISELVTGGDNYAYLSFSVTDAPNRFVLVAINGGSVPLYDIGVRLVDLEAFSSRPATLASLHENNYAIGNMGPDSAAMMGVRISFPEDKDRKDFNIFFSGRNGFWTQLQRFRRVDNSWRSACQVFKHVTNGREILFEKIDEEFPRDENDTIKWE